MPPFAVKVDPSISLGNEETPYLRHDHDQGTFVMSHPEISQFQDVNTKNN
jgi:hypothetical protein